MPSQITSGHVSLVKSQLLPEVLGVGPVVFRMKSFQRIDPRSKEIISKKASLVETRHEVKPISPDLIWTVFEDVPLYKAIATKLRLTRVAHLNSTSFHRQQFRYMITELGIYFVVVFSKAGLLINGELKVGN